MLKNFIVQINKTASIDSFHKTKADGELIFNDLIIVFYGCF
ncbi:hypothetical protein LEP1GSC021_1489 [Leptospira noguchii str. 1993005606]|nr:hypothetical protein LEP1GSC021_1489 [Leptospira noguchii str. 1993005606]